MKRLLILVTMTWLLASCGGSNTVSMSETPTLTAYYGDAAVKGLIYEASPSGLSGVTDVSGAFKFKREDNVSFYIDPLNRIYIGKVKPVKGQIVIPAVHNIFDPEVDASFVRFILYGFDKALAGSTFMDFTDLIMSPAVANKIRGILSRKENPNLIDETWQSLSALQAEVVGYKFKNSGTNINKLNFSLSYFHSVSALDVIELKGEDFLGVHFISYGLVGAHFNFLSDGVLLGIRDDGLISRGTYVKNINDISYRWDDDQSDECSHKIEFRKKGSQWSLITIGEYDSPIGCRHNNNHSDVLGIAKINESVNLEYVSGRQLRIPARGLCAFGEGDAVFSISSTGPTENQRNVEAISSLCTRNHLISGVVKESGVPGVLIFEFDNSIPKSKFFFSILQESGRAFTQVSSEKTVPNFEFDFVYGAETKFSME